MIHGDPKSPDSSLDRANSGAGSPSPTGGEKGVTPPFPAEPFPTLTLERLGSDPLEAFVRWFAEARLHSNAKYPDAMTLSTVDEDGWPGGRIVLLKGVDPRGLSFFTNYHSVKGRALEANPRGALTFYWGDLMRQVRVKGEIERLSPAESDEYFRTRPRGSQIGAWASEQSAPLESREVLEARAREVDAHHQGEVPRPSHWGGYRLVPHEIEFWQEGASRLHDRFRYRRASSGEWAVERLSP